MKPEIPLLTQWFSGTVIIVFKVPLKGRPGDREHSSCLDSERAARRTGKRDGARGRAPSPGAWSRDPGLWEGVCRAGAGVVAPRAGDSTLGPRLLQNHHRRYRSCRDRSHRRPRGSPQEAWGSGASLCSKPAGSGQLGIPEPGAAGEELSVLHHVPYDWECSPAEQRQQTH